MICCVRILHPQRDTLARLISHDNCIFHGVLNVCAASGGRNAHHQETTVLRNNQYQRLDSPQLPALALLEPLLPRYTQDTPTCQQKNI